MTPEELTAEREKLGLTQARLARALGLTPLAIWRYQSGMYKVPKLMQMALRGVAVSLKPKRRTDRR